jgi:hypothetical protein
MIKMILIVLYVGGHSSGANATTTVIEFFDMQACQSAAQEVRRLLDVPAAKAYPVCVQTRS